MQEEAEREKEAEREQERARLRDLEEVQNREKRRGEELERRKAEHELTLLSEESWLESGKTDIPCLFDKKCAFMSVISSLPRSLEQSIVEGTVPVDDLTFRRYKTLMLPLDRHISNAC